MGGEFGTMSLKMAGSLILILGLIIFLFYILKHMKSGSLSLNRYPEMRILGTVSLAPKRAVALVEICDQWLVVGVGTESVTLLSKFDRPPQPHEDDTDSVGNTGSFQSFLQNRRLWLRDRKGNNSRENV